MLLNGSGTPLSTSQPYTDFSVTSHSAHEPPANDRAAAAASAYLKTVTRNLKTEFPLKSCKQPRSSELRLARRAGPWRCLPAHLRGGTAFGSSPQGAFHPLEKPRKEEGRGSAARREEQPAGTTRRCAPRQAKQCTQLLTEPSDPPAALQFPASGQWAGREGLRAGKGGVRLVCVVREGALRLWSGGRMQARIRRGGAGRGRSCGIPSAGYLRRSYTRLPLQLG